MTVAEYLAAVDLAAAIFAWDPFTSSYLAIDRTAAAELVADLDAGSTIGWAAVRHWPDAAGDTFAVWIG